MDTLLRLFTASSLREALLCDVLCALLVHKVYNIFEVNPADFLASFLLLVGLPALPCYLLIAHFKWKILAVLCSFALFYSTLVSSIVLYRISPFHPLAKYPGPLVLKISKFATMYYASKGKQNLCFKSLHDKYGCFVRVGPNEVSIADVDAIPPILGLDGMRKGPQWEFHYKPGTIPSILALRDVQKHHERRRLWNHGFTSASLKEFQPIVASRVLLLVEQLRKHVSGETGKDKEHVDLAQWLAYFTYDFMGDMLFGGGFELMQEGDKRGIRTLIEGSLKDLGIIQHIPWITRLLHRLAAQNEKRRQFRDFGISCYDARKKRGATKRDLFHYITNEDNVEKIEVSREQGLNETFAAIVAGADTTATVLGGVFFYILSNPASFNRLQAEVDATFPLGEGEPFDAVKLAGMPYLNAVINEALRLQPAVPTSIQRCPLQGSGGKWVAGRFIPENSAVYIPVYVLQRDERYFSPSPDEFIPERWLENTSPTENSDAKFTTNTEAFIPFSTGPSNCAGKFLALMEMRMVVATLAQKFDMKLLDGYDPREWGEALHDYFVMKVGELPVVLIPRE